MIVQNILLSAESYTHSNWVYRDVYVGFSRLYYAIDGEAYYEECGKRVRFQKGHLYLTPVKKCFTLTENPNDKFLHTYAHIITLPAVEQFIEIPVREGTPLHDAVMLWRKYANTGDMPLLNGILQFLLSCISLQGKGAHTLPQRMKEYIDGMSARSFCMREMSIALGYTREHLTRCFLDAYHVTPRQYFNSQRMGFALQRLRQGERVCAVAEQLGFSSPYAFSKAFKSHFGLSPEKYLLTLQTKE